MPGLPLLARGNVRDIYDLDDVLLIVATDRISSFDVVLPTPIPDKGRVLTHLSRFWFKQTESIVRNHFLTMDLELAAGRWESLQPLKQTGRGHRVCAPGAHRQRGRLVRDFLRQLLQDG